MSAEEAELTRGQQMLSEGVEVRNVGTKFAESLQGFRVCYPCVDLAHVDGFIPQIADDSDGIGLQLTLDLVPIRDHSIFLSTQSDHNVNWTTL